MQGVFGRMMRIGGINTYLISLVQPSAMKSAFSVLCLLGACASASPEFWGVAPVLVQRGGFDIQVWHTGPRAQAIRMGYATRHDQANLRRHLLRAIEDVTGCAVNAPQVVGDTGVLTAGLNCPAAR